MERVKTNDAIPHCEEDFLQGPDYLQYLQRFEIIEVWKKEMILTLLEDVAVYLTASIE